MFKTKWNHFKRRSLLNSKELQIDKFKQILLDYNIRPTYQRIKILEYLDAHKTHPTVEEIYNTLYPGIPTLSKTTVYNTLRSFSDAKLVQELHIDDSEVRFDIDTSLHGHFLCKACGKVHDFDIVHELQDQPLHFSGLEGFSIAQKQVYFTGLCKKCNKEQ